jgi:hypothetical protein
MRSVSGCLFWSLWTAAAVCAAQPSADAGPVLDLPAPSLVAPSPVDPSFRAMPTLPPPAPAFVDPRSGAWQQRRTPPWEGTYPVDDEGVVIGAGRYRGLLERIYRHYRPYCPNCR